MYTIELEVAQEVETEFIEGLDNFGTISVVNIDRTHPRSVMITVSSPFKLTLEDLIREYCDGNVDGDEYKRLIMEVKELTEIIVKGYNDTPPKMRAWIVMHDNDVSDHLDVIVARTREEVLGIYRESLEDKDGNLDDHMKAILDMTTFEEATLHSAEEL